MTKYRLHRYKRGGANSNIFKQRWYSKLCLQVESRDNIRYLREFEPTTLFIINSGQKKDNIRCLKEYEPTTALIIITMFPFSLFLSIEALRLRSLRIRRLLLDRALVHAVEGAGRDLAAPAQRGEGVGLRGGVGGVNLGETNTKNKPWVVLGVIT